MKAQQFGMALALIVATHYATGANSTLDQLSGRYEGGYVCPKELAQLEGACEAWRDSNYISITKISPDAAKVEIARGKVVQKKGMEPQPYYCFIDGYAKLHGSELVFYKDSDGNHIRGLRILLTPQKLQVIDKAQAEHRPAYCGDYATFDQFAVERRQKRSRSK